MAPSTKIALNLALAVVASSSAPLLLLDGDLIVLAASASFCLAFDIDCETAAGQPVYWLGSGEWEDPKLHSLLDATIGGAAEVQAYEFELKSVRQGVRLLLLGARLLDYEGEHVVHLLLSVADVTDERARKQASADLVRENAMLLQEVQHRVANSLQIIASVLMQSARKVQSEETRGHLKDAHNRVMSIAALQRQLATTNKDDVALHVYLTQLCKSIGASMITDPAALSIVVEVDDSKVAAGVSVSLGLVVTELVINSLKHGFPDGRHGRIVVSYAAHAAGWVLSVVDDGVGMAKAKLGDGKPGLGTSIVEALAKQLHARIEVTDAGPGTAVAMTHGDSAATAANDPQLKVAV